MVVVSLRRQDRGVTEKRLHLRQRHSAFGQPRGVLVSEIMPVESHNVRALSCSSPSVVKISNRLANRVAEHGRVGRFLLAVSIEPKKVQHCLETDGGRSGTRAESWRKSSNAILPMRVADDEPERHHLRTRRPCPDRPEETMPRTGDVHGDVEHHRRHVEDEGERLHTAEVIAPARTMAGKLA
jgi:hypothetical protein